MKRLERYFKISKGNILVEDVSTICNSSPFNHVKFVLVSLGKLRFFLSTMLKGISERNLHRGFLLSICTWGEGGGGGFGN